ncbi:CRISPR-associated endonuclease Cas2 [Peptostreptococcus equinus]|uniref:CRISPR-associated endoribonuclease Cas2 n=1 Tax=Peptostreptococcus equinus TaxID=3003601 RepID=A0ABY7JR50_9FIRM|nr:CRISPR-associated endonuclease Cas2 [Peptostreptococcus sp. CBA3647]WAW14523.1 CRISPR-associated endonuclease Cas2 [Peptostreptococcus sp. CBA3647]
MLIISYDISDNKLRTQFSKFLSAYGYRLQYSVFDIENSARMIDNITSQIEGRFMKKFSNSDSVIMFKIKNEDDIIRYGYAKNDEKDMIVIF